MDAIIYGRDLTTENELVSEERFDKIRYYLKHAKYPTGADRAEKSRLRSAATHYKLVDAEDGRPERLMLKGKEVISDPQAQYKVAQDIHVQAHGGINKTTQVIAMKYHWVRIKETVGQVIKNCPECKDSAKAPPLHRDDRNGKSTKDRTRLSGTVAPTTHSNRFANHSDHVLGDHGYATVASHHNLYASHNEHGVHPPLSHLNDFSNMSIDPTIMEQLTSQLSPPFQDPGNAYAQAGLPTFGRSNHMHDHNHQEAFRSGDNDHYMTEAPGANIDHDDSVQMGEHLGHDGHLPEHQLQGSYIESEVGHFQQ